MVFCKVPGQVLRSKGREGGEGGRKLGRGGVGRWGGAGDLDGGKRPFVSALGDDGGKAGFLRQDGGRCGEEIVCCPSRDSMPEAVHAFEGVGVGGEGVGAVAEYGKGEARGDAVAQEGSHTGPRGGQSFDEGEDGWG